MTQLELSRSFLVIFEPCLESFYLKLTAKDLIRGQKATVASFSDEKLAVFLAERGVVAGERLTVERIAPMGDPIAIRVADHLLCLRSREASSIIVQPEGI